MFRINSDRKINQQKIIQFLRAIQNFIVGY